MEHIRIAWSALMLMLGGAALHCARQAGRASHDPSLRHLLHFTALNIAIVTLSATGVYACKNLMGCSLYECSPWPFVLNGSIQLCLLGIALTHARFAADFLDRPLPARAWWGFAVLGALLLAAWVGVTFTRPESRAWPWVRRAHVLCLGLTLLAGVGALVQLTRQSRVLEHSGARRAGRAYAVWHGALYAALAAALCWPQASQWIPTSLLALPAGLFPLWWLPRRFQRFVATPALVEHNRPALEELFGRHDVSPREREVAGLILQGKSNKEIEETLCISIHTVKNHASRLYEKLGVHSRGQLVNLIREHERGLPPA